MREYRSIELNVRIGCPVGCSYCPQAVFVKAYHGEKNILQARDLMQIVNNATHKTTPIDVFFSGMSEPLAVDNWMELVQLCQSHRYVRKVVIFTTGYKLETEEMKSLSRLNKLRINFHIANKEELAAKVQDIARYLPNALFRAVGDPQNNFKTILEKYGLKLAFQPIISRAGNLGVDRTTNLPITCIKTTTEKRPVVLPDGLALVCTNDYGCEMEIGNLLNQTWDELDFDKILIRQDLPDPNFPCFRNCHFAKIVRKFF